MRVLFVCSGNICRSPMAAQYLRHRLPDGGVSHVVVDSAGTLGIERAPASAEAIRVLEEHGIDLRAHRSRGLRGADLKLADLVLVMALDHLDAIERLRVQPTGDVRLLREFETGPAPKPGALDIPDPIGRPIEFYREVFETIRRSVDHVLMHIRSGSGP